MTHRDAAAFDFLVFGLAVFAVVAVFAFTVFAVACAADCSFAVPITFSAPRSTAKAGVADIPPNASPLTTAAAIARRICTPVFASSDSVFSQGGVVWGLGNVTAWIS